MASLLIGEVAERTALTPPTIRYYEAIGLVKPPARSEAGYRRYSETTVAELLFVRKAQALGFSLDEIAEILKLSRAGRRPCSDVLDLARRHLAAVDDRIQQLQRFRAHLRLAGEIGKWDGRHQPTCDGLCEIIASAGEAAIARVDIALRSTHSRHSRSRESTTEVKHGQRRSRR